MSVGTMPELGAGPMVAPETIASGAARTARAYAAARRHSRLVRVLRGALVFGAIGGVATLAALALYRTFGPALARLSVGQVAIDGSKITMDRPRLTGTRADGGGYVINAARAIQDIRNPTDVELATIDGDIVPADHDTLHMTASAGHYDSGREWLDLTGVVRLKNNDYTVDLHSAHIDFKAGTYSSTEPVTVETANGASIVADSASVRDSGKEITFEGHVRSLFRPNAGEASPGTSIKGTGP